jgi:hypothetical protein
MSWVLIAAFGLALWLLVAAFVLALCHAAGRADALAIAAASEQRIGFYSAESNVVDFCAFRAARRAVPASTSAAATVAGP